MTAGVLKRMFAGLENSLLKEKRGSGINTALFPVFETPEEAEKGSPFFLDMAEDGRILYDRDGFFGRRLDRLREKLAALGARRISRGNGWYWDLKPDYKPGDVVEL